MYRSGTGLRSTSVVAIAMAVFVASAVLLAGCGSAPDPKRAKLETVANFFAAASNGDKAGAQALAVDPDSPALANITAASGPKVTWSWKGETIVMSLGTTEVTFTISDSDPSTVIATAASGVSVPFGVKQVGGVWKVDTTPLEAASADAQQQSCFANQRTIEGAYQTALASGGEPATSVADLVPEWIKTEPVCPTTKLKYTLLSGGVVEACSAHGHY
jgi:hypothetical protein